MIKTNVMRILEKSNIEYKIHDFSSFNETNGGKIAKLLNEDPSQVYKTLVCVGKSKQYYVFMIQVNKELDLKKCAKCTNEKNIELIHQKELFPLTGYYHGGCSPLGMKKQFKTYVDESILLNEKIFFSGGKIGIQVELNSNEFLNKFNFAISNLTK